MKLREIFSQKEGFSGWLYLPEMPWSLDTEGIFVKQDKDAVPDSTDHIPELVKRNGWGAVLEAAGVEDIIYNVEGQLDNPTPDELLKAFVFYVENDAFIDFEES